MNTPNPLVPQGSMPQGSPGKFNIRLVVFGIIAAHSLFFCGLLIQGCSKPKEEAKKAAEPALPPILPTPAPDPLTNAAVSAPLAPPAVTPGITPGPTPSAPITPAPSAPLLPPSTPTVLAPPTELPPMTTPTEGTREHVVAKNDSFYTLSKKYKVSMKAIEKANPGVDSSKLKLGQKLQIPAGGSSATAPSTAMAIGGGAGATDNGNTYTVKSGDNLGKIAAKNGTTVRALRDLNGLKSDRINVGQKLKVPAKGGGATPAPSIPATDPAPLLPPPAATTFPAATPTAPGTGR